MIVRLLLLCMCLSGAPALLQAQPLISIIIDDMGNHRESGLRAARLPGAITYSILPHTPWARYFSNFLHARGSEIMLHLPMQARAGNRLGPGGVTLDMDEAEFRATVRDSLAAVPHARGLNNHMGGLLTRRPEQMAWLMSEIRRQDNLFFVDSVTTRHTVAQHVAHDHGLPNVRRDVFLDSEIHPDAIRRQFALTLAIARKHGSALAIGHPHAETLTVLEEVLPQLEDYGVELVPVSALIAYRQQRRPTLWHASLSPLPPAVKSLKP